VERNNKQGVPPQAELPEFTVAVTKSQSEPYLTSILGFPKLDATRGTKISLSITKDKV